MYDHAVTLAWGGGRAQDRHSGRSGTAPPTTRVAPENRAFYLQICLRLSFTMRAPMVAAAPPSIPFVMVSLCSVPNFLADATIGSAAAWNASSKAPEPVAAS